MKFRKKPVVVDAIQWWKHGDHPAVQKLPDGHQLQRDNPSGWINYGWCNTLEGGLLVTPGDWIITGVVGEVYPCKPDIFSKTYEAVPVVAPPDQPLHRRRN